MDAEQRRRMVDAAGAADYLGVSLRTMRTLVNDHGLPCHKVGRYNRFDLNDLDAYLDANRVEAAAGV